METESANQRVAVLLDQAKRGSREATSQLLTLYRDRLKRMVGLRLDPRLAGRVDASDVVQESLLEADRRLPEYMKAPSIEFYLWLRQLTVQKLIDLHRHHVGAKKRSADRELSIERGNAEASSIHLAQQLLGSLTTPTQAMQRMELQGKVQEALDKLDPVDREVLALRHFEQLTNEETAQVLGLSRSGASKRYITALGRLKEHLAVVPEVNEWMS